MRETHSFDFGPKPDGESQSKENKISSLFRGTTSNYFFKKKICTRSRQLKVVDKGYGR